MLSCKKTENSVNTVKSILLNVMKEWREEYWRGAVDYLMCASLRLLHSHLAFPRIISVTHSDAIVQLGILGDPSYIRGSDQKLSRIIF